ncbi:MAG: hypothetical protein FD149_2593 [Rhodospirillaceae bacterium]|nr:MAG: hypothetical protein FD149_2593 [Rhodospirillaceae bacterium]
MPEPITLKQSVSRTSTVDLDDVLSLKNALQNLGYYHAPSEGLHPYPDTALFTGIERLQKDHGLAVDGFMKPGAGRRKDSSMP